MTETHSLAEDATEKLLSEREATKPIIPFIEPDSTPEETLITKEPTEPYRPPYDIDAIMEEFYSKERSRSWFFVNKVNGFQILCLQERLVVRVQR